MTEHIPNTKRELLKLVLASRDAGTMTGKFLKKIRQRALTLMMETACGDMVDLDLIWIGAGCPKGKEPRNWLASLEGELALHVTKDIVVRGVADPCGGSLVCSGGYLYYKTSKHRPVRNTVRDRNPLMR